MKYEFIEVYSSFLTCSSVTDMDKSDFAYLDIRRNIEPILIRYIEGSGISNFTVYMILSYLSDPVILDVHEFLVIWSHPALYNGRTFVT
ncbi:unnamed protein product [Rhizophagus irregularis]|nr:unnamed protein product [Rhizophagus irregularis]CAB5360313.1 unnamed protein product [Rhizophagus irregularis]